MKREITSIDFGEWMRSKRRESGMSKKELGKRIGYHYNSITRFEEGCQFPPLDIAEAIVNALGAELIIRE